MDLNRGRPLDFEESLTCEFKEDIGSNPVKSLSEELLLQLVEKLMIGCRLVQ